MPTRYIQALGLRRERESERARDLDRGRFCFDERLQISQARMMISSSIM